MWRYLNSALFHLHFNSHGESRFRSQQCSNHPLSTMPTDQNQQLGDTFAANDAYSDYPVPPPSSGAPGAPLESRDRDPLPPPRGRSRSRSPDRAPRSPPRSSYRGKSPATLARPKQAPIVSLTHHACLRRLIPDVNSF